MGSPIGIIGEPGDDLSGAADLAKEAASAPPPAKEEPKSEPTPAPKSTEPASKKEDKPSLSSTQKEELRAGQRIFATPIAKKIALERGIPLSQVKGSGPEGRILREDVERFKPSASPAAFGTAAAPGATTSDYTDIPISNMRRVIGQRLTQSKQELPHYYLTVDIDMGKVAKLREVFNAGLKDKEGAVKISVNDFIMKAVSLSMGDVPEANSAWLGETIRQYVSSTCLVGCVVNGYFDRYKKVDISMAVSTPTGLITPIIKDVASKGLASIAAESKALAKKARDGKLAPHEYQVRALSLVLRTYSTDSPLQGGTFTVSNLGMYDITHFTAIINPPQSCILAIGSTIPTIVPAPNTEKGWETKQIMKVTLSSDHRTVDGAVGARWLKTFKGYLENPLTFML